MPHIGWRLFRRMGKEPGASVLNRVVVVCALGYFVDIYDLLLFNIVRRQSLHDLGVPDARLLAVGADLLNWQMGGLLLGGIVWGVLGDRRGRRSVLFGSIALYSLANLGNALVQSVPMYAALRFVAGIGLAGELGAAITLVSEALPAARRGYGTMLVSAIGILGAVAGFSVSRLDWRVAYLTGGILGLLLLAARLGLAESPLFAGIRGHGRRGDLRLFLGSPGPDGRLRWLRGNGRRLGLLARTSLVGVPLWCAIGILVTFSPEIAQALRVRGAVDAGAAVLAAYGAASLGSLASGWLSQRLRSRRTPLLAFLAFTAAVDGAFLLLGGASSGLYLAACAGLGFGAGYWAVFMQTAAEQFGTDLRATVTTAAPNLVRGSVVPLTLAYRLLAGPLGLVASAVLLLCLTLAAALAAAWSLPETFGRDLDFLETAPAPADGPAAERPVAGPAQA
jgi:putative MFS transporter